MLWVTWWVLWSRWEIIAARDKLVRSKHPMLRNRNNTDIWTCSKQHWKHRQICKPTHGHEHQHRQNDQLTDRPTDRSSDKYGVATVSRSIKLQVSFAKEPYKRGNILQKRPINWKSLLIALEWLYILHSAVSSILRISTYSSAMSPIKETVFCKRDLEYLVSSRVIVYSQHSALSPLLGISTYSSAMARDL